MQRNINLNDELIKQQKFDHISFRLNFIKDVLKGKAVGSMIDLDNTSNDTANKNNEEQDIKSIK